MQYMIGLICISPHACLHARPRSTSILKFMAVDQPCMCISLLEFQQEAAEVLL